MASPSLTATCACCFLLLAQEVRAQQTTASTDASGALGQTPLSVNADGMLLAQNDAAIDQARLYRQSTSPVASLGVDANGNALPASDSTASDNDSFGAQQILKSQERPRPFTLSGGAAINFTDNVGLTRNGEHADGFAVVSAGISWTRPLVNEWEGNLGFGTSLFRYFDNSALDFESLNFGAGLSWNPARLTGVGFFARYDFTELFDPDLDQILMEHTITLGVQKLIPFGRAHGLTLGAVAIAGFSNPSEAQRSQLGAFLSYRLRLARKLDSEILFRPAVFLYSKGGRADYNQVISMNFRYHFTDWADVSLFFSYGLNRSNRAQFDYNALTTGAGIGFGIRF